MILGVTQETGRLLMAAHYGAGHEEKLMSFSIDSGAAKAEELQSKSILEQAGETERGLFSEAEKIIYSLPSINTYLKLVDVDNEVLAKNEKFLDWIAGNFLPGAANNYHYDFIPLTHSFDAARTEFLFFAAMRHFLADMRIKLCGQAELNIKFLPEQLGLVRTLAKSLGKASGGQAGIVHCTENCITAVYARDGRYSHSRFFANYLTRKAEVAVDIETYFLSRADAVESLPLVITGNTGCFTTGWSPIVPVFLGIHNMEYAGVWGVADHAMRGV